MICSPCSCNLLLSLILVVWIAYEIRKMQETEHNIDVIWRILNTRAVYNLQNICEDYRATIRIDYQKYRHREGRLFDYSTPDLNTDLFNTLKLHEQMHEKIVEVIPKIIEIFHLWNHWRSVQFEHSCAPDIINDRLKSMNHFVIELLRISSFSHFSFDMEYRWTGHFYHHQWSDNPYPWSDLTFKWSWSNSLICKMITENKTTMTDNLRHDEERKDILAVQTMFLRYVI